MRRNYDRREYKVWSKEYMRFWKVMAKLRARGVEGPGINGG